MKPVCQQIIEYLRQYPSGTASDLARSLGKTPQNIRHHLNHLQAEGKVTFQIEKPHSRGRPQKRYRLVDPLTHTYQYLADVLLKTLFSSAEPANRKNIFEELSSNFAGDYLLKTQPRVTRLNTLIDFLNSLGYRALWEAHDTGPRILFSNCPFSALVQSHPELCKMDCHLLERWIALPIKNANTNQPPDHTRIICQFQF